MFITDDIRYVGVNDHNHEKITFGIDNNPQPESGCTSWIYLPDNYKYEI